MIELRSAKMKELLKRAKRRAKGRPPSEGPLRSLIYETAKNGWHYQVEWVHDLRCRPKPYIVAYAFKPPLDMSARFATHYLEAE